MKIKKALKFLIPALGLSAVAVALPIALTSCSSSLTNFSVNQEELNTAIKKLSQQATSYDNLIQTHFSSISQIQKFFTENPKIGIDGSKITAAKVVANDGKDGYEQIQFQLTFEDGYGIDNNSKANLNADTTFMNGSVTKLFTINDGIITSLTDEAKKQSEVKIPGYSYITGIGASVFSNVTEHNYQTLEDTKLNKTLTTVVFEGNNIKTIGTGAFDGCVNLTSINFPNSLTQIADYAFKQTGIAELVLPNSLTTIGANAFYKCNNLISIKFSGAVQNLTLGEACFSDNAKLVSVAFPEGLTTLPKWCLTWNDAMTTVSFPSTLTTLEYGSISNSNKSLKELDFTNTQLKTIGDSALYSNSALTTIKLPNTLKTIGMNAFWKCTALESINIPASVESISTLGATAQGVGGAFTGCSSLKSVEFGATTNKTNAATSLVIGQNTFDGCSSLTSITLPSNVVQIQSKAFSNCTKLTNITIQSNDLEVWKLSFYGIGASSTTITVPTKELCSKIQTTCNGQLGHAKVVCPAEEHSSTHS